MEILKNYPKIGKAIYRIRKQLFPKTIFTSSDQYWKERYAKGGNSGPGSYSNLAEWKGEILNAFVKEQNITSVIELGCGDGNQLTYFNFPKYIGVDISADAIKLCKEKFATDSTKSFVLSEKIGDSSAELAISLDVLYHLIEEDVYDNYLSNLFNKGKNFVIIYAYDSEEAGNYGPHVKPRKFTKWVKENKPDFNLVEHIPNKYPPIEGKENETSFADFFIYERIK